MTVFAVETSCDETSAAVVCNGRVLSNIVSSQMRLHSEYGGVVPELATREHLRNLLPVAQRALTEAGVAVHDLSAVAATQGPGLPSALLIGFHVAQSMAFALNIPLLGIQHHEAHLYSPWIHGDPAIYDAAAFEPSVSLIVSGGHTLLVHVRSELDHALLGGTVDDAAGECFDKVAKLIGLPYPGGPEMDRLAQAGNPRAYNFPRPMLNEPNDDFSFSGLKTAVRYFLRDRPETLESAAQIHDLCASVQAAIVDVLVTKTIRAARRLGVQCLTASGGVTANRGLRLALTDACKRERLTLRLAEKNLCTDNAAMIGILAERKLLRGHSAEPLESDIRPGWTLG